MMAKGGILLVLSLLLAVFPAVLAVDSNQKALRAGNDATNSEEPRKLSVVRRRTTSYGYHYGSYGSYGSSKSSKGSKGSKGSGSRSSNGRGWTSSKSSKSSKGSKGGSTSTARSRRRGSHLLQRCEGDCDRDSDCASGLKCFHRGPYTAVPGCIGGEKDPSRTDYCVLANYDPMIEYVGGNGKPAHAFPLKECQGDCDNNSDCAPGLVCFQRDHFQPVPGCRGGENDSSRTDYCIRNPSIPTPRPPTPSGKPTPRPSPRPTPRPNPSIPTPVIKYVGNDGHPSYAFPLSLCEGDCDNDSECGPGLRCYQRNKFQAVPGCSGGTHDASVTDYCVASGHPNTPNPTPRPNPSPTPRPHPSPTPKPPGLHPEVERVGNDGKPSSAFPLGRCQGDCDDDDDCDYGLFCFQRSRYDAVPGCRGGESDSTKTDYCAPLPPDQQPPPGTFRLKLYWEEGYNWQEESRERKWCMTFDYDGWPGTGECWYGEDSRPCSVDQVHISKCSKDKRQRFLFVELSDGEVLIKLGNGKNECFERSRRSIYVRTCDADNKLQRWYAINGSFDGDRFEISQRDFSTQCVTTAHHPKAGEVVELHSCRASRSKNSETSFWNKY